MSLLKLTLPEIHNKLHAKEISVSELTAASYARIGQVEEQVRAYLTLDEEGAMEAARRLDDKLVSGEAADSYLACLQESRTIFQQKDYVLPAQASSCQVLLPSMMRL